MHVNKDATFPGASGKEPRGRKRSQPSSDGGEQDEEEMDEILPAATAMKRRRIDLDQASQSQHKPVGTVSSPVEDEDTPKRDRGQNMKRVDVLGAARERREAEDEAALRDDEALQASLGESDVRQLRNLALVEDMHVQERTTSRHAQANEVGSRWDERWNGRKNFKKFRRQGTGSQHQRRQGTVMIGFEEVKKKGYGIGEEYWLESEQRKEGRDGRSQDVSPSPSQPYATARTQPESNPTEDPDMPQIVEGPHNARPGYATGPALSSGRQAKSLSSASGGKRAASSALAKAAPPSKKQKQKTLFARGSESDESDDELKFRFKKKR